MRKVASISLEAGVDRPGHVCFLEQGLYGHALFKADRTARSDEQDGKELAQNAGTESFS